MAEGEGGFGLQVFTQPVFAQPVCLMLIVLATKLQSVKKLGHFTASHTLSSVFGTYTVRHTLSIVHTILNLKYPF